MDIEDVMDRGSLSYARYRAAMTSMGVRELPALDDLMAMSPADDQINAICHLLTLHTEMIAALAESVASLAQRRP